MGDFTPEIRDPSNVSGRGAEAPKSVIGDLADIFTSAATQGLDLYRNMKGNELQGAEGEELSQAVRDYAKNSDTALVGSNPSPAANDPGYQAATSEIDKHAAAAAQGAPGAKQALLTRLSEITSRYASQNPYYAPQLQEYAQKTLGFNANAQLFSVASDAEDFQRSQTKSSIEAFRGIADSSGATVWDANGNVDVKATVLNGQKIALANREALVDKQNAETLSLSAKTTLTEDQITDQEFRIGRPVATQIAQSATGGLFSNLSNVFKQWDQSKPIDQALIASTIGQSKSQAQFAVNRWADTQNLGFKSRDQLKQYVDNMFQPFSTIMGQDLTSTKQVMAALQKAKDLNGLAFHETAPHAAAAIDVGGPTAAAALIQQATAPNSTNHEWERLNGEINGYFKGIADPHTVMRGANGLMAGKYSIANEPDRLKAREVLKTSLAVADKLTVDPARMDIKGQQAFGNIVAGASEAAVQSGDHQSILNAGARLAQPNYVQGLIAFGKNPANANAAPKTFAHYGQFLRQVQKEASDDFVKGTDTTIYINSNQGYRVHVSGTVDQFGHAVPVFAAKDVAGNPVTLTGDQRRQALMSDPAMSRSLDAFTKASRAGETVAHAFPEHFPEAQPQPKEASAGKQSQGDKNAANNNPGNLRTVDGKGWQKFATPEEGIQAVGHQIGLYIGRGKNTISQIVSTYAPATENDTTAYIADIALRTGIDPNTPVDLGDIPAIRDAMIEHEQRGSLTRTASR